MNSTDKKNNVLYTGTDTWINQRTGEIIEASQVVKKTERNGFMITYLSAIINLIDSFGTKRMEVVKYILNNMDKSNNILLITNRELAKKTGVSLDTVTKTLKSLRDSKIIKTKTGIIMVNPKLIHKGDKNKESYLLMKFSELEYEKKEDL